MGPQQGSFLKVKLQLWASSLAFHPTPPSQAAAAVQGLGLSGIEFLCEPPWTPDRWTPEVVEQARRSPLRWSLHAPVSDLHLLSLVPQVQKATQQVLERTVDLAEKLGAQTVNFHLGLRSLMGLGSSGDDAKAQTFAKALNRKARRARVTLTLENDPPLPGAHLADLQNFARWLGELEIPGTLDLGHAWLAHGPKLLELLPTVLPYLHAVHLHDNRGAWDEHLALGEGSIPWPELWPLLRTIPVLVVEAKDEGALRKSLDSICGLEQGH